MRRLRFLYFFWLGSPCPFRNWWLSPTIIKLWVGRIACRNCDDVLFCKLWRATQAREGRKPLLGTMKI